MTSPAPLDLLDPRLRPLCDAILREAQVPGASVSVVVADRCYQHLHGVKSITSGEPVTPGTGFNIGSCSKAFASATVASLVADGLVRWDDPISTWVPELQFADPRLTEMVSLRDLAANRLGLPRGGLAEFGLDPRFPAENLFARLRHTPSAFPFRDRFGYVNAGHAANSVAVGRITGKGFLATLRERILAPLGMTGTSGGAATPLELKDLSGWHVVVDGRPVEIEPVYTDQYLSSGGMVVSGADALAWLRLHLNGGLVDGRQVVAREALLETHRPHAVATPGKDGPTLFYPDAHMAAYALGWAVSDLEGHPLVAHSGSDMGVAAMTLLLPASGIGIAVYGNSIGGGPGTLALAYALAATLLSLKPRDWLAYFKSKAPVPPPAAPAEAAAAPAVPIFPTVSPDLYAGRYAHPADGTLDVRRDGDLLVCTLCDAYRLSATLLPCAAHRFTMDLHAPEWKGAAAVEPPTLTFTVVQGQATQAEISGPFAGRPFLRQPL